MAKKPPQFVFEVKSFITPFSICRKIPDFGRNCVLKTRNQIFRCCAFLQAEEAEKAILDKENELRELHERQAAPVVPEMSEVRWHRFTHIEILAVYKSVWQIACSVHCFPVLMTHETTFFKLAPVFSVLT